MSSVVDLCDSVEASPGVGMDVDKDMFPFDGAKNGGLAKKEAGQGGEDGGDGGEGGRGDEGDGGDSQGGDKEEEKGGDEEGGGDGDEEKGGDDEERARAGSSDAGEGGGAAEEDRAAGGESSKRKAWFVWSQHPEAERVFLAAVRAVGGNVTAKPVAAKMQAIYEEEKLEWPDLLNDQRIANHIISYKSKVAGAGKGSEATPCAAGGTPSGEGVDTRDTTGVPLGPDDLDAKEMFDVQNNDLGEWDERHQGEKKREREDGGEDAGGDGDGDGDGNDAEILSSKVAKISKITTNAKLLTPDKGTSTRGVRRLREKDIGPGIEKRELLVFWEDEFDDWYRADVVSFNSRRNIVQLHYVADNHRESLDLDDLRTLMKEKRVKIVVNEEEEKADREERGKIALRAANGVRGSDGLNGKRVANDGSDKSTDDETVTETAAAGETDDTGRNVRKDNKDAGVDPEPNDVEMASTMDGSVDEAGEADEADEADETDKPRPSEPQLEPKPTKELVSDPFLDKDLAEHYELGIMREQSAKFNKLKHIALGEYFCVDAMSLGKAGDAFDWHDAKTGIKFARHDPIDKLLDEQVVSSALVYRLKKWDPEDD